MKNSLLILSFCLVLTDCTSPTFDMPPAQIASLSDDQICSYENNYRNEAKLAAEISKRHLDCNRFFRQCLKNGNTPNTQAMQFCMDTLRENERLRYEDDRFFDSGVNVGIYNRFPIHH